MVEGRKKDLINRGGEKISAEEIENLILSHPAVQNVACIAVPDPDLGERMCACIILRDGQSLTLDELKAFLIGKEIAKFKLPERHGDLDRLPALDVRQGLEEGSRRDGRPNGGRLTCESSTCTATRAPTSGSPASRPYVDALGEYWARPGWQRRKSEVVADFAARRGRGGARRLRHRDGDRRTRRARNDYVAAMREPAPRDASSRPGARSTRSRASRRSARRRARSGSTSMLGFHFHPIMGHYAVNEPALYPLFETIAALRVPVMIDVGTTGMGAGMPGGMGAPGSSTPGRSRSTTWPPASRPDHHRGPSRLAVDGRDDRGRAAQGQRVLGAFRLGAQVLPAAAAKPTSGAGCRTR